MLQLALPTAERRIIMGRGHGGTGTSTWRNKAKQQLMESDGFNVIDNIQSIGASDLLKIAKDSPLASGLVTHELNRRLEIRNNDKESFVFSTPNGKIYAPKGFSLYIEGAGYVGFSGEGTNYATSKRVLNEILNAGGFTDYSNIRFSNPVGIYDNGQFKPLK